MRWNKRSFALELILDLYKEDRVNMVQAIKLIRGVFGVGLYDSKKIMEMVQAYLDKLGG